MAAADVAYVAQADFLRTITTAQFDKTNATLANVTGLSLALAASTRYAIRAELMLAYGAGAGGFKIGLGGTATKTSCSVDYFEYDLNGPTLVQLSRLDLFGSSVVGTPDALSTATHVTVIGTFVSNAAGTLTVTFAQSSTNATASSVLIGSTLTAFK
jgi:hypothetical protein